MKLSELSSLEVYTDGGASNNGNANGSGVVSCYGSFLVVAVTKTGHQVQVKHNDRIPFPDLTTNNQAEYKAFVSALQYLDNLFMAIEAHVPVHFRVDSKLVYTQVFGTAKCKALGLQDFCIEAKLLVENVKADCKLISGDDMKVILGH